MSYKTYSNRWPLQSPGRQASQSPGNVRLCDWCCPRPGETPLGQCICPPDSVLYADGSDHLFDFVDLDGNNVTSCASGIYIVRYCRGAWIDDWNFPSPPIWAITRESPSQPQFHGGNRIYVQYQSGGVTTNAYFNETGTLYSSQQQAEHTGKTSTNQGMWTRFTHSGGIIQMGYVDSAVNDNVDGSPNPTFVLCTSPSVGPLFSANGHSLFGGGPSYTGDFFITNLRSQSYTPLTYVLQNTGGISGAGSDIFAGGDITIPALGTVTTGFNFTATLPAVASIDCYLSGVYFQTVTFNI